MKPKTKKPAPRKNGPGRRPLGRIKTLVSIAPETLAELRRRAEAGRIPVSHVIDDLVAGRRKS